MENDFLPGKDWLPSQVEFIIAHLSVDKNSRQLADLYHCTPEEIWRVALAGGMVMPNMGFSIARGMRKATWHDAYVPMSLAEFHEIYPDGLRE